VTSKTTLIQVARSAGVSLSTVDRVLNRRGGVSHAKEAKVLEWSSRLNLDRIMFRNYVKALRVAVLMQSPQNPFYRSLRDAFADSGAVVSDAKIVCFIHYIEVTDAKATTRKIAEIAESYDALVVVCPDDPQLSDALRMISKSIPIVTLVTDLPKSGRIAYVGPDNRQTGRVAGELMGRFLGPAGGGVLIVLGMHRIIGHEEREMGFRSVLRERFPLCAIVASLESGEDQGRAGELVYEALRKKPDVRGIYNVSAGNTAIARAICSLGLTHDIVLITHELTSERRVMLREGVLDAIIDQNPRLEVQRSLEILGRHFNRVDIESPFEEFTQFDIFLRENCPPPEKLAHEAYPPRVQAAGGFRRKARSSGRHGSLP
jgi:LacI family transcriptional regulator, galactose operon repressor